MGNLLSNAPFLIMLAFGFAGFVPLLLIGWGTDRASVRGESFARLGSQAGP